jgi:hypothetical protein
MQLHVVYGLGLFTCRARRIARAERHYALEDVIGRASIGRDDVEGFTIPSAIAVAAAVGAWLLILAGHPVWALLAAVLGLGLGIVGLFAGVSSRNPQGIASLVAVFISLVGIGVIGIMFSRIFV